MADGYWGRILRVNLSTQEISVDAHDEKNRSQITIHVKLSGFFVKMVPEAKFEVGIHTGATIEEFLTVLTQRYGEKFRRAIVDRNGKPHADIAIIVNIRFIPPRQITEHRIHETSTLSIIPIAGGG
jgi:sulfur carrier protein ThiS